MLYRAAADAVVFLHLAFIVFVVAGAAMAIRYPRLPLIHIPAAAWGAFVEVTGGVCPLTYAENFLRLRGDQAGYPESFIAHYLLAIIYPDGLTREIRFVLAAVVVAVNCALYAWILRRRRASSE